MKNIKIFSSVIFLTFLSITNDLYGQHYFSRVFEHYLDGSQYYISGREFIKYSDSSFVVSMYGYIEGKPSTALMNYNPLENDFFRSDKIGILPTNSSLVNIDDNLYMYAQNMNNDSLSLINMDLSFNDLSISNYVIPGSYADQYGVFQIDKKIYGLSHYYENGMDRNYIRQMETSGEVNWNKNYYENSNQTGLFKYTTTQDKHILVGFGIRYNMSGNYFPTVVKLDTLGNEVWRYQSTDLLPLTVESCGVIDLGENGVIMKYLQDTLGGRSEKWVWLDKDGSYIKEEFKGLEAYKHYGSKFLKGKGDYFYGYGSRNIRDQNLMIDISYGLISKIDYDGEIIWSHSYRHPDFQQTSATCHFKDLIEEENGDLVILAKIFYLDEMDQDYGPEKVWLFRLDSLGCPDPEYCDDFINFSSTKEDLLSFKDLSIYPNPASQLVTIDLPEFRGTGQLLIINNLGQVIRKKEITNRKTKIEVDISGMTIGNYYVRFQDLENPIVYKASLIIQNN